MPFEDYRCAETYEQAGSSHCAVSIEDWCGYSSTSNDCHQETQALVDEGTLPDLSFLDFFAAIDKNNDCVVSADEFLGFFERLAGSCNSHDSQQPEDSSDIQSPANSSDNTGGVSEEGGSDGDVEYREPGLDTFWPGSQMETNMGSLTIGDTIPPELQKYASMEGETLVIDARGEQLPRLTIARDNVVIKNARVNARGSGEAAIEITGSHVKVQDSEITGGTRGILANGASDVTVDGNYLHDFDNVSGPDGHAIEFRGVRSGVISNNQITGTYKTDAINMLGSSDLKVMYNRIDVRLDEWSAAPLMVEDGGQWLGAGTTHDIEVAYNDISYSGGVPPGLLGGYNLNGHDNVVNGDRTSAAWQLYYYEPTKNVWHDVYYDGRRIS